MTETPGRGGGLFFRQRDDSSEGVRWCDNWKSTCDWKSVGLLKAQYEIVQTHAQSVQTSGQKDQREAAQSLHTAEACLGVTVTVYFRFSFMFSWSCQMLDTHGKPEGRTYFSSLTEGKRWWLY